ncbi:MAG: hypothetical protein OEW39_07095 [Deltaproteobacteria bacterium]|nr:hypothetical protein [Deltaproteobacteria bacterium]
MEMLKKGRSAVEKYSLWVFGFIGAIIYIRDALTNYIHQGDTVALLSVINAGLDCLSKGIYSGCYVLHFPIFQYIPMAILRLNGAVDEVILMNMIYINLASFFIMILLVMSYFRGLKRNSITLIFILSLITSALFYYTKNTYNETTAAMITLAFTLAALKRSHGGIIAILFILAGSTKEVAFPFLILIGVACWIPQLRENWRSVKGQLIGLLIGALISLLINSLFNYFRFASILNTFNMDPKLHVPSLDLHISLFGGILFSPNAGILFFCTLFSILIGVVLFLTLKENLQRGSYFSHQVVQSGLILAILFGLIVGFSSWYAPYGWIAWGPRLILPWMPSLFILTIALFPDPLKKFMDRLFSRNLFVGIAMILIAFVATPQLGVMTGFDMMIRFFSVNVECPKGGNVQEDRDYYFQCLHNGTWTTRHLLLPGMFETPFRKGNRKTTLLYYLVLFSLVWTARNWHLKETRK